jgi:hypothetical protein
MNTALEIAVGILFVVIALILVTYFFPQDHSKECQVCWNSVYEEQLP